MASSASRSEVDEDKCFFGKITGEEAEEILKKEGGEEGTFLIRESCSSPGNYVLSFITEGYPIHILIQKYREDAFFSLVVEGESPMFHGLDTLVGHYCQTPVGSPSSTTTLSHPCPGDPLPAEARLHGASSLLHRSSSQGNLMVVTELLKSGYRKLDDKNNRGQTALHLACMKGYKDIATALLQAGAFVEARNEEGLTPLHLASRHNKSAIVRLLVETSAANVQARAANTGSVALHEAAEHGNIECLKTLLALGAPSCPRNQSLQTPIDLAKRAGHIGCYNLLIKNRPFQPKYKLQEYYHGNIDRVEAQKRLQSGGSEDTFGLFLLRQSSRKHGVYVLTLLVGTSVFNYEASGQGELLCIDDGPYFASMEALVDHYVRFVDGFPCLLTQPLPPPHPLPSHLLPPNYLHHIPPGEKLSWEQDARDDGAIYPYILSSPHPHEEDLSPLIPPEPNPSCLGCSPPYSTPQDALSWHDNNCAPGSCEVGPHLPSDSHILRIPSSSTLGSYTPDIVVTKTKVPSNLMKFVGDSDKDKSPQTSSPSLHPSLHPSNPSLHPSRESLRLDLQNLSLTNSSSDSSINPSGSSPTMDGNRTHEILGEIDMSRLTVGPALGNGEFGSVLKGIWLSPSGDKIDVAVKMLHQDDKVNKKNFLKEAEVMMNLNHLYIVQLVGVCHGPPVAMVQELMSMGSLLDFVLEHETEISVDFHLKLWAAQIAEGMRYLEQRHFVHRDLAARNILLSSITLCKISDFGLSRAIGVDKDYYTSHNGGRWPLKWYAPESIYYGTFTHSSDVWSYGITLWEMYTFGDQPYGSIPGHKVVEMLEKSERLPAPEKCPRGVFELMLRCWSFKPPGRPSFRELAAIFRTQPEYINIKPYFK